MDALEVMKNRRSIHKYKDIPLDYEEDIDINLLILEDESLKQPESIITQPTMPLIIQWNFVEKN